MLKKLFTSNTRIKLLTVYLMNPDQEYYIRELTRKLNEQINSVRRELDNLKKIGLLRSRTKDRKKFYYLNKDFLFVEELKSIFIKALSSNQSISKDIAKLGPIKLLVLSGVFANQDEANVDMLVVGDIDAERLSTYLNSEIRTKRPVKFTIMNEEDYQYRIDCNDRFVKELVENPNNIIPINKFSK